jgi:hypothetical protein
MIAAVRAFRPKRERFRRVCPSVSGTSVVNSSTAHTIKAKNLFVIVPPSFEKRPGLNRREPLRSFSANSIPRRLCPRPKAQSKLNARLSPCARPPRLTRRGSHAYQINARLNARPTDGAPCRDSCLTVD